MGLVRAPIKKWSKQVRVCVAYGENMNVHVHKNSATSRRSGQHRDVPES